MRDCTLEILATDQAGIDVVIGEGDATQFLKVKVQHRAVNGVQIGAASAPVCMHVGGGDMW